MFVSFVTCGRLIVFSISQNWDFSCLHALLILQKSGEAHLGCITNASYMFVCFKVIVYLLSTMVKSPLNSPRFGEYVLFFPITEESQISVIHINRVSMEVSNYLVSWFITYLGDLQPTYKGVIIHLLSTSRTSQ